MRPTSAPIIIPVLTLIVYAATIFPYTRDIVNSLFLLYIFVASGGLVYWPLARRGIVDKRIQTLYFLAVFTSILLWVGVTGWFFSPFFYFLYLLAIMLAFMYSPMATLMFTSVLLGIFIPHVGSVDLTLDIVTIVSLLSVVPLTYFLQKEYLQLKQAEKKVLILEEETGEIRSKVDELLFNKVIRMAVDLREPLNDIRQLAMVALKDKVDDRTREKLHKIVVLGRESLDQIEKFEEKVTGRSLIHSSPSNKLRTPKKKVS